MTMSFVESVSGNAQPLKGKVALITGSTSGIGLEVARDLAKKGANIVLNGFVPNTVDGIAELDRTVAELENYGVKVLAHRAGAKNPISPTGASTPILVIGADVTDRAQIKDMVSTVVANKDFGRVDILVNNAGIQRVYPFNEFPENDFDAVLKTNLQAPIDCTRAVYDQMIKQGGGQIVNIASAHGHMASEGTSVGKTAYITAKHGLIGFTKALGLDSRSKGHNIAVTSVSPGYVITPLVEAQIVKREREQGLSRGDAEKAVLGPQTEGFIQPTQISSVITSLACLPPEKAMQMCGRDVMFDNGWKRQHEAQQADSNSTASLIIEGIISTAKALVASPQRV